MSTRRWTPSKKRPTAAEQRATARQIALEQCQKGYHQLIATFRPGERICSICGVVFYCLTCLNEHHQLPAYISRAYVLACVKHQEVKVQA